MALSPESVLRLMKNEVDDQVDALDVSIGQIQGQIDQATEQAEAIDEALMDPAANKLESYIYGKATEIQYPALTYQGFWDSTTSYVVDDLTTIPDDSTGGQFVCIQAHTSDSTNEPGSGASWTTYWTTAGPLTTYRVSLGAGYNATTIDAWAVQQFIIIWTSVYSYNPQVAWDGDVQILELQNDWDFGCDYLNHPLGVEADAGNSPDCVLRVASGQQSSYGLYPKIASLNTAKTIVTNNQTKIANSEDVFDRYLED